MRRLHIYLYILLRAEPVCVLQGNQRSLARRRSIADPYCVFPACQYHPSTVGARATKVGCMARSACGGGGFAPMTDRELEQARAIHAGVLEIILSIYIL